MSSMYFRNSFIVIRSAFCQLIWNNFSSEHSYVGCFGIIEGNLNNSEKYDANSIVLIYCLIAMAQFIIIFENIWKRDY